MHLSRSVRFKFRLPVTKPIQKPTVSIIGAGRLGQALALALQPAGYAIVALVARRRQKAEKAAGLLDKPAVALSAKQLDQLPSSDVVIIATPDDAIENVAARLATSLPLNDRGLILHTSGALSSEVLLRLAKRGFHTGSVHPLVSVSESRAGAKSLGNAFYCVEGDQVAIRMARKMVRDLGGTSFSIKPENKALYHAAALLAAGHLTALIDLAIEMLVSAGLNRPDAQKVLLPLVESAVANLKNSPPARALTGTFARGDLATVERHLKALTRKAESKNLADSLEVYRLLGLRSLELAKKNGLDARIAKRIRKLLEAHPARK